MTKSLINVSVLLLYVATSISGMTLLKGAAEVFSLRWIAGFLLYGGGFAIWIFGILRLMPLSHAFPFAAGALIIGTQFAGWLFLKERISVGQTIGIVMILGGVLLVSLFSRADA